MHTLREDQKAFLKATSYKNPPFRDPEMWAQANEHEKKLRKGEKNGNNNRSNNTNTS